MTLIALQMLARDRAKFFALLFAIASATFLISQQVSIFVGLMNRTTSQIKDAADAPIWVMHPRTVYVDEIKPMPDSALPKVRSVEGVEWAVPFFKGFARASAPGGHFRLAILLGLDDATLVGLPRRMVLGSASDLSRPDAVIIDDLGYTTLFPGEPLALGRTLELNDRRATIVGIARVRPPFQTFPVIYSKFTDAARFIGRERNSLSFVIAQPASGITVAEACRRIEAATALRAMPKLDFAWATIAYYIASTGIPVNFGITIVTAIIVGAAVSGQTLYLFVVENLRYFATLKAVGASDARLTAMIAAQAGMVTALGYGIGIGLSALFFESTREIPKLRLFLLHWPTALGTLFLVLAIGTLAGWLALRRVRRLEPGVVFKG